jgi:Domain of unknown function (DUF4272)
MTKLLKTSIKTKNNKLIKDQGYEINKDLPLLSDPNIRDIEDIKTRLSIMNALSNIAFEAPTFVIKSWLMSYKLARNLSEIEQTIVDKPNDHLSEFEINSMMWYMECVWALMWVLKLTDNLEPNQNVGEELAELLPNLEEEENNGKVIAIKVIRTEEEIYTMLDCYYRLHSHCVNQRLTNQKCDLDEGRIYERRKALEWAFDKSIEWDFVEINT